MPDMDGFTLVERMNRDPHLASTMTILMLSSSGGAAQVARCRGLGIAGCLTKPVGHSELQGEILRVLGAAAPAATPSPSLTDQVPERRVRLRVLVAEDNAVNQQLAAVMLERLGHDAVVVGDGRAALEALTLERFHVVLMDVQMPVIDGLEATATIRRWEAEIERGERTPGPGSSFGPRPPGYRIPIIALTAHAMKADVESCLATGMDGYLAKPLKREALAAALARVLPEAECEASMSP
jgi:CheY-like chemotaxis protein